MGRPWRTALRGSLRGAVLGAMVASMVVGPPGAWTATAWAEDASIPVVEPFDDWATFEDFTPEVVTGADVDDSGSGVLADGDGNVVLQVAESGETTALAGTGEEGTPEDGETATEARLSNPRDVATPTAGTTYIADAAGAVHMVQDDVIETLIPAGELDADSEDDLSLAVDTTSLYVSTAAGEIYEIDPDNPELDSPLVDVEEPVEGLDVGPDGVLYAATGSSVVPIDNGTVSSPIFPADAWEEVAKNIEMDTLALDVAVSDDDTVYVVGDSGLIVIPRYEDPYIRPYPSGDVVAHGLGGNLLVSDLGHSALLDEADDTVFLAPSSPGEVDLSDEVADPEPGTIATLYDEPEWESVTAMSVSDGKLVSIGTDGFTEASPQGISTWWDNSLTASPPDSPASIVPGQNERHSVLTGGLVRQRDSDGTVRPLAVGVSRAAAEPISDLPRMEHMAALAGEHYVASDRNVYSLDSNGILTPVHDPSLVAGMDIVAMTADRVSGQLYVAVGDDAAQEILHVSSSGDSTVLFTEDDVPGDFIVSGMAVGPDGSLFVTDDASGRVLRHAGSEEGGEPEVVAGGGEADQQQGEPGPADEAAISEPTAPVVDSAGTLFFVDGPRVHAVFEAEHGSVTSDSYPLIPMSLTLLIALSGAGGVLYWIRRRLATTS